MVSFSLDYLAPGLINEQPEFSILMHRIFDKPTMSHSQKSIAATKPFVRGSASSRLSVFERSTSKAPGDQFEIVQQVVNFFRIEVRKGM